MKKIKYLALTALFCAFGVEAMATTQTWANRTFRYTYDDAAIATGATIIGFVNDYPTTDMATVTIPDEVTQKDNKTAIKVTAIAADAFKDNTNIKKVIFSGAALTTINATAFSGCTALETVDFSAATGVTTIGAGAFTKAPITALDLSKTKLTQVNNLLGTTLDSDPKKDVKNTSLTEVSLPKTWTSIAEAAFANCTSLATISFGKADAAQTINTKAFAYCPITALDFTDTKVSAIPAELLYVNGTTRDAKNESLTSVTLTDQFTVSATGFNSSFANCTALKEVKNLEKTAIVQLNAGNKAATPATYGEFEGDVALATINVSKITTFGDYAFQNCEALTAVTFAYNATTPVLVTLGKYAFAGTGLTKVTFPKGTATTNGITAIPEGCFFDCTALAEVKWADGEASLSTIGEKAFAGTAIAAIDIPTTAPLGASADDIAEQAFAACDNLVTFKWNPATYYNAAFNYNAFYLCNDYVTIYTADELTPSTINVPAHAQVKYYNAAPGTEFDKLAMTAYKNGESKYYYKFSGTIEGLTNSIAIDKAAAKVYSAYYDAGDDATLNMVCYKPQGGKYIIGTTDVCLVISTTEEVEYTDAGTTPSTSMAIAYGMPALKMLDADKSRTALLLEASTTDPMLGEDAVIYGWVNTASNTGFKKIATGKTLPAGTLYAFAKEPAAGGRLTVKWYDENGNLENVETTAIEGITNAEAQDGEIFNLQGVRVNGAKKGLYIKNGKKFIVK